MTKKPNKYDVRLMLEKHLPSIMELLGEQNISWTSINKKVNKYFEDLRKEVNKNGSAHKDATFYTIIMRKVFARGGTDGMFDFFNELFTSLSKKLSTKETRMIGKTISSVLNQLDGRYLNYIGELAVLDYYLKLNIYSLIKIEEKIHPEKNVTADFKFVNENNEEILIDVLNLRFEIKSINDFENLKNYMDSKLDDKISQKIINPTRTIFIQPVIWVITEEQLILFRDFYTLMNYNKSNVKSPLAYITFRLPTNEFEHKFESVETILG